MVSSRGIEIVVSNLWFPFLEKQHPSGKGIKFLVDMDWVIIKYLNCFRQDIFLKMLGVFEYNKTRLSLLIIRLSSSARVQHKQISIRIKPDQYALESSSVITVKVQFFSHHFYNH